MAFWWTIGGRKLPRSAISILEDGDVLRAPEETWLAEPNDELVTLFAKALGDARMGGSGWLADGGDELERVPDRREGPRHHDGPERRSHS